MYDVITFDCYGTLVDWEDGITRAIAGAAERRGLRLGRDEIIEAYHAVEPEVQAAEYRSYREVLGQTAVAVAARLGWTLEPANAGFLAESLRDWVPFPDTNQALKDLNAQRYRLGILSNVDDDLLRGTLRHLSVPFDFLVTAEQLRSYKPATRHFERAQELVGDARWLHVAQSYFHDIEPAVALGIPVVWVNRKGESPGGKVRPTGEVSTLKDLLRWLRDS